MFNAYVTKARTKQRAEPARQKAGRLPGSPAEVISVNSKLPDIGPRGSDMTASIFTQLCKGADERNAPQGQGVNGVFGKCPRDHRR